MSYSAVSLYLCIASYIFHHHRLSQDFFLQLGVLADRRCLLPFLAVTMPSIVSEMQAHITLMERLLEEEEQSVAQRRTEAEEHERQQAAEAREFAQQAEFHEQQFREMQAKRAVVAESELQRAELSGIQAGLRREMESVEQFEAQESARAHEAQAAAEAHLQNEAEHMLTEANEFKLYKARAAELERMLVHERTSAVAASAESAALQGRTSI